MRPPKLADAPVMLVVSVGLILSSLIAARIYVSNDSDITSFIAFGEEDPVRVQYGLDQLGEVFLREGLGHDGKFFFIQANDPWLMEPHKHAAFLDRPIYRSQRMLYPILSSSGGLLSAERIVWAMLLVNIAAFGAGTLAVAKISREMGGSAWWGLAFGLNIGLISEMSINGAGVLGAAAAFGGLALLLDSRTWGASALLALAALSREAMLLAAVGGAYWLWRRQKPRSAAVIAGLPLVSVASWAAFVRARLGESGGLAEVQEIGWPFVGMVEALEGWLADPIDLAVGAAVVVLLLLTLRRTAISDALVGWSVIGFAGLAFLFTEQVWRNYFDITRAVAPVITAFVLLVFLTDRSRVDQRRSVHT